MATPASWLELDVDPATRTAGIARLVRERAAASGVDVAELEQLLGQVLAEAAAHGAVYAAAYSDVLEGRPVSASLILSVVEAQAGQSVDRAPPGRAALAEGIRRLMADAAGDVEVRSLPAGPAVRVRQRAQAPVPGGSGHAEVETVRYLVPMPGDGAQLAVLAFSTPTLGLAEPFGELFDAIAGTLTWT